MSEVTHEQFAAAVATADFLLRAGFDVGSLATGTSRWVGSGRLVAKRSYPTT